MRVIFIITLFFVNLPGIAQKDSAAVLDALLKLEKSLVSKDSLQVSGLLHTDVSYGHSNGWVQTKKDVLKDMGSGYLVYSKIENQSVAISMKKKWANVKERIAVEGIVNGNAFKLNLFVMQVWVQTKKKGWQLMARQSAKL